MTVYAVASAHERDCSTKIRDYLLSHPRPYLGLEQPITCTGLIRRYARGELEYDDLIRQMAPKCARGHSDYQIMVVGDRERPIFDAVLALQSGHRNFRVFAFENPSHFLDRGELDKKFSGEVLSGSSSIDKIIGMYELMVRSNEKREKYDSNNIANIARSATCDISVLIGANHAPFLVLELRKLGVDSEMFLPEEFLLSPRDELMIRRRRGEAIGDVELREYAKRDISFSRDNLMVERGHMSEERFMERHERDCVLYSSLVKEIA